MTRWWKFNAVGVAGAVLQVSLLWALERAGVNHLIATVAAVEAAILHNFY